MARLAKCPKCEHELLVPDGAVAGAWSRCPSCRAYFQLKDAPLRDLPTLEVVESAPAPDAEDSGAAQTVADFPSSATWGSESQDDDELHIAKESEPASIHIADELDDAKPQAGDESDFDDLAAMFNADDIEGDEESESAAEELLATQAHVQEPEVAGLHVAEVDETDEADEALDLDAPIKETPEAAAERIDAWFRSAKTLADVPSLESVEIDYHMEQKPESESSSSAANSATVDLGSGGGLSFNDDFELDAPQESPKDLATWDDSQHMDRLLAELQDQPADELVASVSADTPKAAEAVAPAAAAAAWSPDEALAIRRQANKPRRERSIVRTLLMTTVGGLMGLGLGYYALLWLRGPEIDFLQVAKYLPQAILPASFHPAPRQMAAAPPVRSTVEDTPAEPISDEPAPTADETAKAADATPKDADAPAEKLATFTEPVDAKKSAAADGDRYGIKDSAGDKPAEPAAFDVPPATPVKEIATPREPVHISGAPSFTATELSAALEAGKGAEAGLVDGNLADDREVARTKGFSYSILADLAQKVTFADAASSNEVVKLQQEADELFRKTLATPHARDEVSQIVPKWITSPNRRQGGVFFAGSVVSHDAKGTVSQCSVDLGGGQSLPVLVPAEQGDQLKGSSSPVAVVGWIVDKPAEQVAGYTGSAPQAVYAAKLIPLE